MNSLYSSARRATHRVWICRSCQNQPALISRASYSSATTIQTPARTRFAPSPTGYLHLGSLRTALYNYLMAKSTGGKFILRIEDTDQSRTIADSEAKLSEDLKRAGLEWDEGPDVGGPYGPYRQSERTELYREHAQKLLHSGHAYRCFCTSERLKTLGKDRQLQGLPPDYDRTCTHISSEESDDRASKGEAHVVRLKVPAAYPDMKDLVYKTIRFKAATEVEKLSAGFEDPVLLKSDGFPTYHLANVVDDHYMEITHVIRGVEWINSTPKHIFMYNAFGWKLPTFAHVGLLTNVHGSKLSKRSKVEGIDMTVASLRDEQGILTEAMVNFAALLGWSHTQRSDIMNLQELVRIFKPKFTKGNTIVNFEKLWFLQRSHAEKLVKSDDEAAIHTMIHFIRKALVENSDSDNLLQEWKRILDGREEDNYIKDILRADSRNYTTGKAFVERNKFFFTHPNEEWLAFKTPELMKLFETTGLNNDISMLDIVESVQTMPIPRTTDPINNTNTPEPSSSSSTEEFNVANLKTWAREPVKIITARIVEKRNASDKEKEVRTEVSKILHGYLRWAVSGSLPGMASAESMYLLGAAETGKRLGRAEKVMRETVGI